MNVIKELCGKHGKYSVKILAEQLGISVSAVYKMRKKGKLPYTDLTGKTAYWKKIQKLDKSFTKKRLFGEIEDAPLKGE